MASSRRRALVTKGIVDHLRHVIIGRFANCGGNPSGRSLTILGKLPLTIGLPLCALHHRRTASAISLQNTIGSICKIDSMIPPLFADMQLWTFMEMNAAR